MRSALWLTAVLTILAVMPAGAQSAQLTGRANAANVGVTGMAGGGGRLGAFAQTGFSIAGVLDLGFMYGITYDRYEEERQTDIGMTYSMTPLKQNDAVPVSVQVYGTYTFRTVESDFLSNARLQKEGQGYSLHLLVAHDLNLGDSFALRFGAIAGHRLYRDLTTLTFAYIPGAFTGPMPVDYGQYPLAERDSRIEYGPYLAGLYYLREGSQLLLGISALWDTSTVRLLPQAQLVFAR